MSFAASCLAIGKKCARIAFEEGVDHFGHDGILRSLLICRRLNDMLAKVESICYLAT